MHIATCRACRVWGRLGAHCGARRSAISFLCERGKRALPTAHWPTGCFTALLHPRIWQRHALLRTTQRASACASRYTYATHQQLTRPHACNTPTRIRYAHSTRHHASHRASSWCVIKLHTNYTESLILREKFRQWASTITKSTSCLWEGFVKVHENDWRVLCILKKFRQVPWKLLKSALYFETVSSRSMKSTLYFLEKFRQWVYFLKSFVNKYT